MNDTHIYDDVPADITDVESMDAAMAPVGAAADDGTVTIGLPAIGLVVFGILALAVGYVFGRSLRGDATAQTSAQGTLQQQDLSAFTLPKSSHGLVGTLAPEFTLTRLDSGQPASLSDYTGRPVMVNFWATWCPPCRYEMPWLQAAAEAHPDMTILAVNAGERVPAELAPETIGLFAQQMGLTFPILFGPAAYEVQNQWQVLGLPATFLVGPDGVVVDAHSGMYPSQAYLEQQIRQFLGEIQG
jgi:thiol-disulfide isomerase/thioredoxin